MLTPISKADVPSYATGKPRSERRIFANESLTEFMSTAKVGDIVEVTELPLGEGDTQKSFASVRQAFTEEAWSMSRGRDVDLRDEIRIFSRQGRLFLERMAPKPKKIKPKPNPYPGDLPRV